MPDEITDPIVDPKDAAEEVPPVVDPEVPPVVDEEKPALTLDEALAELEKVRREAANRRTQLRDAEAKLAVAKTPEEYDAAIAEFKASNERLEREVLVTRIASKYELPDSLAARLVGNDEAALEADAKVLAALVTTNTSPVLKGGLDPAESDDDFDPVKAAHAAKARRY